VLGKLRRKRSERLKAQLALTDARIALTKVELAAQMIKLAGQTDDLAPLKDAEEAMLSARKYYGSDDTPIEYCLVQAALGDMLLNLGRRKSDKVAIERAKASYRQAITLASLQGDEKLRSELRAKIKLVNSLLGQGPKTPSLFRAA